VKFCDFACERGWPRAQDFGGVGEGFRDSVRGLKQDQSTCMVRKSGHSPAAFALASGKKSDKQESLRRESGSRQRG
jgi:hypothetical protein